jgi:hypothetical protein
MFAGEHARPGRSWTSPRVQPFARAPPDYLSFLMCKFPARAREIAPEAGALPSSAFLGVRCWLFDVQFSRFPAFRFPDFSL